MSVLEPKARSDRSHAVDALRGAAIVSMFAANLAGACLQTPHPLWLRVYGSFAAPTFVLLAGMMTCRSNRRAPLAQLLKRALWLLTLAAGVDFFCWRIIPFESFDVLYLLGLAVPVVALCARLPAPLHLLIACLVFVPIPWLHRAGYGPLLPDHLAYPWPIWRRLLVDGWFPLFPWLGVALLGGLLGRALPLAPERQKWLLAGGAALGACGGLAWWRWPPHIVTRMGYSELFYPPSLQYMAIAIGAVLLASWAFEQLAARVSLNWLAVFGRSSLLLYVGHVALIAFVLDERFASQSLPMYLVLYGGLVLGGWLTAWIAQRLRSRLSALRERAESGARA